MPHIATPKKAGISDIPPEILSEIFVHCLPTSQKIQQCERLGSVCRRWRTLVLATPALWASLDMTCIFSALHPPLSIIRTHLRRSKTHPLSFTLRTAGLADPPNGYLNALIALKVLSTARERWCNVHITLSWMTQDILDLIILGDAPLLQSIQCDVSGPWHQWSPIPLCMLHGCPRLESFRWDSPGSPLLLPLRNVQLTSLSLRTDLSVSECVTLLRLSPCLSSAAFDHLRFTDSSLTLQLTHPTLRTLSVKGEEFPTLLDALTLPALLDLDLSIGNTGWHLALATFLMRSDPILHQLSLDTFYTQGCEPALLRILALTPHLRVPELASRVPFTAALIRALHPTHSPGTNLCPCLQTLQLNGAADCPDGLCSAMLRARWGEHARANGVACLDWGYIKLAGCAHNRDREEMEGLRTEGMRGAILVQGLRQQVLRRTGGMVW